MTYRTQVDVAADCPIYSFLHLAERFKARIIAFEAQGPGGGNPCLDLAFDNRADAFSFLRVYHDSDDFEWLNSQIDE